MAPCLKMGLGMARRPRLQPARVCRLFRPGEGPGRQMQARASPSALPLLTHATITIPLLPQADPLRKFYTSLLVQRPASDMARKWCVMHGLLSEAEAAAYVDEVAAKKLAARPPSRQAAGSASPAPKRAASGQAPKRKSTGSGTQRSWVGVGALHAGAGRVIDLSACRVPHSPSPPDNDPSATNPPPCSQDCTRGKAQEGGGGCGVERRRERAGGPALQAAAGRRTPAPKAPGRLRLGRRHHTGPSADPARACAEEAQGFHAGRRFPGRWAGGGVPERRRCPPPGQEAVTRCAGGADPATCLWWLVSCALHTQRLRISGVHRKGAKNQGWQDAIKCGQG